MYSGYPAYPPHPAPPGQPVSTGDAGCPFPFPAGSGYGGYVQPGPVSAGPGYGQPGPVAGSGYADPHSSWQHPPDPVAHQHGGGAGWGGWGWAPPGHAWQPAAGVPLQAGAPQPPPGVGYPPVGPPLHAPQLHGAACPPVHRPASSPPAARLASPSQPAAHADAEQADSSSPEPDGGSAPLSAVEQLRALCWAGRADRPRGGYGGYYKPKPVTSGVSVWRASDTQVGSKGNPFISPHVAAGKQQSTSAPVHSLLEAEEARAAELRASVHRCADECASMAPATPSALDVAAAVRTVRENQVTFVSADTGTGKSSLVAGALVDDAAAAGEEVHVCSAQPRRTAAIRLARRVAQQRQQKAGSGDVGYWVRGQRSGGEHTQLWFMTSYTLLLQLLDCPLAPPFTHIIIDEFHERTADVEVTIALLRLCLLQGAQFKLVLMSATQDAADWSAYFEGLSVGVCSGAGAAFPVRCHYLADTAAVGGAGILEAPDFAVSTGVTPLVVDLAVDVAKAAIRFLAGCGHPGLAMLVFLPGQAQVDHFAAWVRATLGTVLHPIPWHSGIDLAVIEAAIAAPAPPGLRKVYLATDIAEVSVTVPDAVFVVDLCLMKRPAIDIASCRASSLFPPLSLQWVSKASIAQRRGRVGRTRPGMYFAVLGEAQMQRLSPHVAPPIQHTALDNLCLAMLQVVESPSALCSLLHRSPHAVTVGVAMAAIGDRGAVEVVEGGSHPSEWSEPLMEAAKVPLAPASQLTPKGRMLQRLPVCLRSADCAWHGLLFGGPLAELMVLAAAVTDAPSVFDARGDLAKATWRGAAGVTAAACDRAEDHMHKRSKGVGSDVVAGVDVILEWAEAQSEDPQWYEERSVSKQRIRAVHDSWRHVRRELLTVAPNALPAASPSASELRAELERRGRMVSVLTAAAHMDFAMAVCRAADGDGGMSTANSHFLPTGARLVAQDAHQPSCVDWQPGQCVVPTCISLRPAAACPAVGSNLAAALTCSEDFWMLAALFANSVRWADLHDSDGCYSVLSVSLIGKSRLLQCDHSTAASVRELREQIGRVVKAVAAKVEEADGGWLGGETAALQGELQTRLVFDVFAPDSDAVMYEASDEAAVEWDGLAAEDITCLQFL